MLLNIFEKSRNSGDFFYDWMRLENSTERGLWLSRQTPEFLAERDEAFGSSWVWDKRAKDVVPAGLAAAGGAAAAVLMVMGLSLVQALPIALVGAVGAFASRRALGLRQEFRDLCSPMAQGELCDVIEMTRDDAEVAQVRDEFVRAGHTLRSAHFVALQEALKSSRRAQLAALAAGGGTD